MFLAGLFITVPYSVSYVAFAITGKADRKLPIVMNSSPHLHSFQSIIIISIFIIYGTPNLLGHPKRSFRRRKRRNGVYLRHKEY